MVYTQNSPIFWWCCFMGVIKKQVCLISRLFDLNYLMLLLQEWNYWTTHLLNIKVWCLDLCYSNQQEKGWMLVVAWDFDIFHNEECSWWPKERKNLNPLRILQKIIIDQSTSKNEINLYIVEVKYLNGFSKVHLL